MGDNEDRVWGGGEGCDEGGVGMRVRKEGNLMQLFALETRLLPLKFIPTPVEHFFWILSGYLFVFEV